MKIGVFIYLYVSSVGSGDVVCLRAVSPETLLFAEIIMC